MISCSLLFWLSNSVSVKFLGNKLAPQSSQNNPIISPRWQPQLPQNIFDSFVVLFCFHTCWVSRSSENGLWFLAWDFMIGEILSDFKIKILSFFESEILVYFESEILLGFFFESEILFYFESNVPIFSRNYDFFFLFRKWDSAFFSKMRFYSILKLRFWFFFQTYIVFFLFFFESEILLYFETDILFYFETAILFKSEIQILFLFKIEIGLHGPPQIEISIL